MKESPYSRFDAGQLILRDELAVDRTLLANERTLLAYLRSAVALVIAGVSIMHFSNAGWFWWIGVTCIPLGVIAGAVGIARYRKVARSISFLRQATAKKPDTAEESGAEESDSAEGTESAETAEASDATDSMSEAFTTGRESPSS